MIKPYGMILQYPSNIEHWRLSLITSLAVAGLYDEPISGGCGTFARTSIRHSAGGRRQEGH